MDSDGFFGLGVFFYVFDDETNKVCEFGGISRLNEIIKDFDLGLLDSLQVKLVIHTGLEILKMANISVNLLNLLVETDDLLIQSRGDLCIVRLKS